MPAGSSTIARRSGAGSGRTGDRSARIAPRDGGDHPAVAVARCRCVAGGGCDSARSCERSNRRGDPIDDISVRRERSCMTFVMTHPA